MILMETNPRISRASPKGNPRNDFKGEGLQEVFKEKLEELEVENYGMSSVLQIYGKQKNTVWVD